MTFEEAAAVPVAAITALQGLRDKGHIQPGQKVLINSAGEVSFFGSHNVTQSITSTGSLTSLGDK